MNLSKFYTRFFVARYKVNKAGKSPLFCKITYLEQKKQFATGLYIPFTEWDTDKQQAYPPNTDNTFINTQISLIKQKINQAFLLLELKGNDFTIEDIYSTFKGEKTKKQTGIIEYYEQFLKKYVKLVNIEITRGTYDKFEYIKNDLANFIHKTYKKSDMPLAELQGSFITDFEYYLKVEKKLRQITINKATQRLKKVVKEAIAQNVIDFNPFLLHKPKHVSIKVIYLTPEELKTVEEYPFIQKRLEEVRDMFVFCCYTGLAYNEMAHLEKKHIVKGFDGKFWIKMTRQKTKKEISVPILPKTANIIDKYSLYNTENNLLLPVISNQRFNSYLKEIADIVGLDKNLTHHMARKTFATTVLLYNDVPMDIVSELLGHSKISITQQHYGKIVQKKVSEHIERVKNKLGA